MKYVSTFSNFNILIHLFLGITGHSANHTGINISNDGEVRGQIEMKVIERCHDLEESDIRHQNELSKKSYLILILIVYCFSILFKYYLCVILTNHDKQFNKFIITIFSVQSAQFVRKRLLSI